jgi:pyruvate/2-oxoglutarate dehydrogenase complex dihydrolipoamide dehydrogenase (E3) component
VLTAPFAENDRARAERAAEGLVKVVTTGRGRILGAGIAGSGAGELILPWTLAIASGMTVGSLAGVIVPYPTMSEASKRAAGRFFEPSLFGPGVRRLVRLLSRLG